MACTSQKIATIQTIYNTQQKVKNQIWQSHDPAISCVQILEGMFECMWFFCYSYFVQYTLIMENVVKELFNINL